MNNKILLFPILLLLVLSLCGCYESEYKTKEFRHVEIINVEKTEFPHYISDNAYEIFFSNNESIKVDDGKALDLIWNKELDIVFVLSSDWNAKWKIKDYWYEVE